MFLKICSLGPWRSTNIREVAYTPLHLCAGALGLPDTVHMQWWNSVTSYEHKVLQRPKKSTLKTAALSTSSRAKNYKIKEEKHVVF